MAFSQQLFREFTERRYELMRKPFFFFSLWQSSLFHETPLKIYLVSYCSIKWESIYHLHLTVRSWQKQKIRLCLYTHVFFNWLYFGHLHLWGLCFSQLSCYSSFRKEKRKGKRKGGKGEGEREKERIIPEADRSTDSFSCAPSWSLSICFTRMLDMARNSPSSPCPLELLWGWDGCKDWPRRI